MVEMRHSMCVNRLAHAYMCWYCEHMSTCGYGLALGHSCVSLCSYAAIGWNWTQLTCKGHNLPPTDAPGYHVNMCAHATMGWCLDMVCM